jgi:hypothetical protein
MPAAVPALAMPQLALPSNCKPERILSSRCRLGGVPAESGKQCVAVNIGGFFL